MAPSSKTTMMSSPAAKSPSDLERLFPCSPDAPEPHPATPARGVRRLPRDAREARLRIPAIVNTQSCQAEPDDRSKVPGVDTAGDDLTVVVLEDETVVVTLF